LNNFDTILEGLGKQAKRIAVMFDAAALFRKPIKKENKDAKDNGIDVIGNSINDAINRSKLRP
jgi:hypothetical protein